MLKPYILLSVFMAAFWATLITFGLHGHLTMFAATFVLAFFGCMITFGMCKSAADQA